MAKRLTIELLAMIGLGLLLGLLGPFGTFPMPPAERIINWVLWLLAGYVFFRPTGIVATWLCEATGLPHFAGTMLAFVVASVPVTLVITMLAQRMSFAEALRWPGFWTMYAYICIVSAVVAVVMSAIFNQKNGRANAAQEAAKNPLAPPATTQPPRDATLPPGFGPVYALKGEDHYVRVIGDGREELILMRMRDAIERLGKSDGLRVHRSWWVSHAGVESLRRDGRSAVITLIGGQDVPVARAMMSQIRAAGWV